MSNRQKLLNVIRIKSLNSKRKSYLSSYVYTTQNVFGFTDSDLMLVVNDITAAIRFTTYAAYIQTYN